MNKFMKLAINEAKNGINKGHGGPFGAVIVKDGGGTHAVKSNKGDKNKDKIAVFFNFFIFFSFFWLFVSR